jgi:hypothetical protein
MYRYRYRYIGVGMYICIIVCMFQSTHFARSFLHSLKCQLRTSHVLFPSHVSCPWPLQYSCMMCLISTYITSHVIWGYSTLLHIIFSISQFTVEWWIIFHSCLSWAICIHLNPHIIFNSSAHRPLGLPCFLSHPLGYHSSISRVHLQPLCFQFTAIHIPLYLPLWSCFLPTSYGLFLLYQVYIFPRFPVCIESYVAFLNSYTVL